MAVLITVFCGSTGLYLLLAGQLSATEWAAALPLAAAIAGFAAAQRSGQQRRLQFRPPWPHVLAPLAALASDSAHVGAVLARAIARHPAGAVGHTTPQPFRPGAEHPADAGRRALVTFGSSLAPNGFVLDIAPSPLLGAEPALLMHRLAPAAPSPDPEWPM